MGNAGTRLVAWPFMGVPGLRPVFRSPPRTRTFRPASSFGRMCSPLAPLFST